MALLKCKMCGGDLDIVEGSTVCVCEYCGTKQTVPSFDSEKKITLFARANRLRFASEFDKAYSIYETILIDYPEEAEAYWGLVLCKYGIEYVDDPNSAKKIPTCHRSSFDSIFDDPNYEQVIENSDIFSRVVYREEAKAIEEIRKGIVEISSKEEPYDIFICYKETDENGDRTLDSLIAQDVYDALTKKGYRVFFSRITLEDKLGKEYEPYIFSALHSAKIMLAFGTDYEYYNSVWVKNEWSRFLKLIENDKEKVLIPCYKGLDAYDMPKEFLKLQSQDMGKVGAIQDLLRGIDKILSVKQEKETIIVNQQAGVSEGFFVPILKKAQYQLENRQFEEARKTYQKVLDFAPNNQDALIGTLLCAMGLSSLEELENGTDFFLSYEESDNIFLLADENSKDHIISIHEKIRDNNKEAIKKFLEKKDYEQVQSCANNILMYFSNDKEAIEALICTEYGLSNINQISESKIAISSTPLYKRLSSGSEEYKKFFDEAIEKQKGYSKNALKDAIKSKDYISAKDFAKIILYYNNSDINGIVGLLLAKYKVQNIKSLPNKAVESPEFNLAKKISAGNLKNNLIEREKRAEKIRLIIALSIVIPSTITAIVGTFVALVCIALHIIFFSSNYYNYGAQRVDGGFAITEYRENDISVEIPSEILGKPVVKIENNAFKNENYIESVKIPSSVTTIGDYAFSNCDSLESIVISYGVTTIGDYAFYDCDSLKSVVIPNSVTTIGYDAFADCNSLTIYCKAESKPSGWDYNWNSSNCPVKWGVKAAGITEDGFSYVVKANGVCEITAYTGTSTKIEIPSTIGGYKVTSIGQRAFYECHSLKSIVIPNSVTTIGEKAFRYCDSLESIEIPNSLTTIGDYAFSNCGSLESIEIPNRVTKIGDYAFYDCDSLKSVAIPNSVTEIGEDAFAYCYSLTIYCEAGGKPSGWHDDWNSSKRPVKWGYQEN